MKNYEVNWIERHKLIIEAVNEDKAESEVHRLLARKLPPKSCEKREFTGTMEIE